jgi:hypothetical protein
MQHRPFNGCVQFSMPFLLHETLPRPPRLSSSYYPPNQTFPHSPYQPVFSEWCDTMANCQSVSVRQTLQLTPPIKLWTTLALPTRPHKAAVMLGRRWMERCTTEEHPVLNIVTAFVEPRAPVDAIAVTGEMVQCSRTLAALMVSCLFFSESCLD